MLFVTLLALVICSIHLATSVPMHVNLPSGEVQYKEDLSCHIPVGSRQNSHEEGCQGPIAQGLPSTVSEVSLTQVPATQSVTKFGSLAERSLGQGPPTESALHGQPAYKPPSIGSIGQDQGAGAQSLIQSVPVQAGLSSLSQEHQTTAQSTQEQGGSPFSIQGSRNAHINRLFSREQTLQGGGQSQRQPTRPPSTPAQTIQGSFVQTPPPQESQSKHSKASQAPSLVIPSPGQPSQGSGSYQPPVQESVTSRQLSQGQSSKRQTYPPAYQLSTPVFPAQGHTSIGQPVQGQPGKDFATSRPSSSLLLVEGSVFNRQSAQGQPDLRPLSLGQPDLRHPGQDSIGYQSTTFVLPVHGKPGQGLPGKGSATRQSSAPVVSAHGSVPIGWPGQDLNAQVPASPEGPIFTQLNYRSPGIAQSGPLTPVQPTRGSPTGPIRQMQTDQGQFIQGIGSQGHQITGLFSREQSSQGQSASEQFSQGPVGQGLPGYRPFSQGFPNQGPSGQVFQRPPSHGQLGTGSETFTQSLFIQGQLGQSQPAQEQPGQNLHNQEGPGQAQPIRSPQSERKTDQGQSGQGGKLYKPSNELPNLRPVAQEENVQGQPVPALPIQG